MFETFARERSRARVFPVDSKSRSACDILGDRPRLTIAPVSDIPKPRILSPTTPPSPSPLTNNLFWSSSTAGAGLSGRWGAAKGARTSTVRRRREPPPNLLRPLHRLLHGRSVGERQQRRQSVGLSRKRRTSKRWSLWASTTAPNEAEPGKVPGAREKRHHWTRTVRCHAPGLEANDQTVGDFAAAKDPGLPARDQGRKVLDKAQYPMLCQPLKLGNIDIVGLTKEMNWMADGVTFWRKIPEHIGSYLKNHYFNAQNRDKTLNLVPAIPDEEARPVTAADLQRAASLMTTNLPITSSGNPTDPIGVLTTAGSAIAQAVALSESRTSAVAVAGACMSSWIQGDWKAPPPQACGSPPVCARTEHRSPKRGVQTSCWACRLTRICCLITDRLSQVGV